MNGTRQTTVSIGNRAEQAAARHLERAGYRILEMNYRRKHCEADIVAERDGLILFVEVKYRGTDMQGSGLDYITALKLRHMRRAALTWVAEQRWNGPFDLGAAEVGGPDYEVLALIESAF